ncbi:MAG: hypothetical protein D8M26_13590 [Ignavibacteriae bacterium]|jgi:hypothetical protein|nr:hypothetical protein [Ignavibacteriota bacterium]MCE7855108.1 hypothetical protein [Ignavibacteria bacterium CHB3]GJQ44127.1 MAG: hypothetical protein JETCAE03_36250 [Ignavibacteriaceae bacterium]
MLDTVIGPITRIVDTDTFQMQITHIGNHNKYSYHNYEIVIIAPNPNLINPIRLSHALIGRRVKCSVRYRDNFNRLICDVVVENNDS